MRAECIRAFVAVHEGQSYSYAEGDLLDLPAGADWVEAGFVREIVQTPQAPVRGGKSTKRTKGSRVRRG